MRVTRLCAEGFRNLKTTDIRPTSGVNLFCGANAQGKTNLLEALWLFTGGRSFRGAKDAEMIGFGCDKATLNMEFLAAEREQKATVTVAPRRTAVLNGVELGPATKLAGRFCGIVFSPTHLSLIKEGPDNRRRFLDAAYCQLRPTYTSVLAAYTRTLTQRNALLREVRQGAVVGAEELLSVFDSQLAAHGARLIRVRGAYLAHIAPMAAAVYDGLSRKQEKLELQYLPSGDLPWDASAKEVQAALEQALLHARAADIAAGFSTVGPHRDDFDVAINRLSARVYGSQGQQRSAVLALKLAEAEALREVTEEAPVALLDDVMSELDEWRQDYLLNHLTDVQVFITCCEPSSVMRMAGGARFRVEGGKITEE
ncbi:MAG: DNA replication/repair protein RecF [Ruminococcaceae bacterium]|nr:DNA replication/repair protein RecF [Oscillospiraceae bacterium]